MQYMHFIFLSPLKIVTCFDVSLIILLFAIIRLMVKRITGDASHHGGARAANHLQRVLADGVGQGADDQAQAHPGARRLLGRLRRQGGPFAAGRVRVGRLPLRPLAAAVGHRALERQPQVHRRSAAQPNVASTVRPVQGRLLRPVHQRPDEPSVAGHGRLHVARGHQPLVPGFG